MKKFATLCAMSILTAPAMAQTIDCVIEPKAVVSLSAKDQGLVSEVLVERGQEVTAGMPVLRQDDGIEALQLSLATAAAESDINLRSEEERLQFRLKELQRVTELVSRGASSQAVLDDAQIEVRLSELAIDRARFDLERARIEQALAAAQLERRTIRAPQDGVVISVDVSPGEYAGTQVELIQIADLDPLYVEVFMPAEFFDQIQVGDSNLVHLLPPLQGSYKATVSVVDPVFDAASGTFGLRLVLPNPAHTIPAGVRCQLELAPN